MRVGFIGTGNMGNPFAQNLIKAGNQLAVHDIARKNTDNLLAMGATWAKTPAEAAKGREAVFTALPGPAEVEAVVLGKNGVLEGAETGCVYIDLTTNSLSTVKKVRAACQQKGVQMLDAPVSGGVRGAINRDLIVMASGNEATYTRVKPLLDAIGDKVTYCGAFGNGTVCKLCHNLMSGGIREVVVEVLTMGVKAGVPLEILSDAISKGAGGKVPPLTGWYRTTFKGEFEGTPLSFYLELMRKDVRLACEMGRELSVPMEIANIVEQRYIEAMNRGWGRMASNVVAKLQEERAGVEIRLPE